METQMAIWEASATPNKFPWADTHLARHLNFLSHSQTPADVLRVLRSWQPRSDTSPFATCTSSKSQRVRVKTFHCLTVCWVARPSAPWFRYRRRFARPRQGWSVDLACSVWRDPQWGSVNDVKAQAYPDVHQNSSTAGASKTISYDFIWFHMIS